MKRIIPTERKPPAAKKPAPKPPAKESAPKPPAAKEPAPKPQAKKSAPKPQAKKSAPKPQAKKPAPKPQAKKPAPKPQAKKPAPKPPQAKNNPSRQIGKGATSTVTFNPDTKIVSKRVTSSNFGRYSVYEREVYWLQYLNDKNYSWCPKLVSTDSKTKTVRMEHVGTRITKTNTPNDWRDQLQQILTDLSKEGIKHNDIKSTEILVKAGKLYLIDFGWASKGGDWSCGQGFDARIKPYHKFHDHTAMERITNYLK